MQGRYALGVRLVSCPSPDGWPEKRKASVKPRLKVIGRENLTASSHPRRQTETGINNTKTQGLCDQQSANQEIRCVFKVITGIEIQREMEPGSLRAGRLPRRRREFFPAPSCEGIAAAIADVAAHGACVTKFVGAADAQPPAFDFQHEKNPTR
jgi:hypothetical protein